MTVAPGPIPKRSEERRRANEPEVPIETGKSGPVVIPEADASWHPAALAWYNSLKVSGQAIWYQQSDWATAYVWAGLLSQQLRPNGIKGPNSMVISAWSHAASELLTTEGARRRARIELARNDKVDKEAEQAKSNVTSIRDRLTG